MTDRLTLAVVTAGLSEDSTTTRLGEAIAQAASTTVENAVQHVHIKVIQLRDLAHGLTDMMITHVASRAVQDAIDTVLTADGLIAASPTYKASYSGLFKMFFDALDEGVLDGMPVVLAATGGTPRHSLVLTQAMLPLFHYLKAVVAPLGVFAATADWGDSDARLSARIEAAAREFAELVAERPGTPVADEFEVGIDFEDLLHG